MSINDLPVLSALRTKMQWHQERQRVLSENVSNSDTPKFRPRDLVEPKLDCAPEGVMWEALVRASKSGPVEPVTAPVLSNFGSTRSRGLKFGVSELETFSESTFWRS